MEPTDDNVAIDSFALHRAVFENRTEHLETVLAGLKQTGACDQAINAKDRHGNSPLHLAVLLNRTDCLETLLAYNARIKTRNNEGWSVLAEAVGCGNRAIVKRLLSRALNCDGQDAATATSTSTSGNRQKLQQTLESVPDFRLSVDWQFRTWIPLASRLMPSDCCRISKCGTRVRVDSTLIDFQNLKWERGNVSYLFVPVEPTEPMMQTAGEQHHPIYVLDHERRVYSPFLLNNDSNDVNDEVTMLMTTPLQQMEIVSKNAYVSRVLTGWFMREAKTQRIADRYLSDFYTVHDIQVVTTKRVEHLTPEDVLKSKKLLREVLKQNPESIAAVVEQDDYDWENDNDTTSTGSKHDSVNNNSHVEASCDSDYDPKCTWDEYIGAEAGQYAKIRPRPVVQTIKSKELKLTVALSKEFPISLRVLTDLLEVVAPLNRFKKLRDFIDLKLPLKSEGFPVRIEFPVFPGVTAQVTFLNFEWVSQQPTATANNNNGNETYAKLFEIPDNYTLEPNARCAWLAG